MLRLGLPCVLAGRGKPDLNIYLKAYQNDNEAGDCSYAFKMVIY